MSEANVTADNVLATHFKHPEWCADEIAIYLDCGSAYVRKTASRWRLVLSPKITRPGVGRPKDRPAMARRQP